MSTQNPQPRTEAQREASRANGRKSQGPKDTSRTRGNALKHGLAGKGVVLPPDLLDDVNEEIRIWERGLGPEGELEQRFVEMAAFACARQRRLYRAEVRRANDRTRRALETWDDHREDEIEALARQLVYRPGRTVKQLRSTSHGCDYLVERWQDLASTLIRQEGLTPVEAQYVLHLLGHGRPPSPEADPEAARLGELAREAARPEPEARASAALALLDALNPILDELTALGDRLWERFDEPEREGATDRAGFDDSPEGKLLARYLAEAGRAKRQALADFYRHRRLREADTTADPFLDTPAPSPEPPPQPAPHPPEPSTATHRTSSSSSHAVSPYPTFASALPAPAARPTPAESRPAPTRNEPGANPAPARNEPGASADPNPAPARNEPGADARRDASGPPPILARIS